MPVWQTSPMGPFENWPGAGGGFEYEGRVEHTHPMLFSADETADVGNDTGSAVSEDYDSASSGFTGTVKWVQLDIDEAAEDSDHLISPEERFRVAMSLQ